MITATMTLAGGHERTAYTIEHRGNCILITGEVPASAFHTLTKLAPRMAVLDPTVARMYGANFAFGLPDDLEALRKAGAPAAEARERIANPGLSEAAVKWLAHGERGVSSDTIFTRLTGMDALRGFPKDVPYDPSDFRRCRLLLEQVPELLPLFPRMADVSPQWAALVANWGSICATMDTEAPAWRAAGGQKAPKTYELIKAAVGR